MQNISITEIVNSSYWPHGQGVVYQRSLPVAPMTKLECMVAKVIMKGPVRITKAK